MAHSNFFGLQESYEAGTGSYTQASFSSESAIKILSERTTSQSLTSIRAYVKARIQAINSGAIHPRAEQQVLAYLGLTSIGPQMDFAPPREEIERRVLALDSSADSIQALLTLTKGQALPDQEPSTETGGDPGPTASGSSAPRVAQGNDGADASGHDEDDPSGDDVPITDEDASPDGEDVLPPAAPATNTFFGHQVGGRTITLDQAEARVRDGGNATATPTQLRQYVEGQVDALAAEDPTIDDTLKTALKNAMLTKMGFTDLASSDAHTSSHGYREFVAELNDRASSFRALYAHVKAQPGVTLGDLPDVAAPPPPPPPPPPTAAASARAVDSFWETGQGVRWTKSSATSVIQSGDGFSDSGRNERSRTDLSVFVERRVEAICGSGHPVLQHIKDGVKTKLGIPVGSDDHTLSPEQMTVIDQLAEVKNATQLQIIAEELFWPSDDTKQDGEFTQEEAAGILANTEHTDRTALKTFVESRLDVLMGGHDVSAHNLSRTKNAVLHHLGFAVDITTDRALTAEQAREALQAIGARTTPHAVGRFTVDHLAPLDKLASDILDANTGSDKWGLVQSFLANKMVEKDATGRVTQDLAMSQTEALKPYFMKSFFGSFRRDAQRDLRTIVKNFVDNIPTAPNTTFDPNSVETINWYQRMQLASQARSKAGMSAQQCADYCEAVAVLKESGDQGKLRSKLQVIHRKHGGGYAELALTGLESPQSDRVLDVIQSKFQRDADPAVKAKYDANRRIQQTAAGKFHNGESGWRYCESQKEAGKLAAALKAKSIPLADVLVVSARHQHDRLGARRVFGKIVWTEHEIDSVTIPAPEGETCKNIEAYMLHAKSALEREDKWNKANQEAVYAYAMERAAVADPAFAQDCMDVQNTHSGKKWVLTPSARKALGVDEGFSLEAARQQAFTSMQASLDCRFIHELRDYRIPSQTEGAGLTTAPSDAILAKLQKYPPLQAEFWRQYWARVFKKSSYALDKQGQPQVGANLDGSTVLHYGKGVFAKVNHDGCSKSDGIHSQEEADGLVTAMLKKRRLDDKPEKPTQPLMAYGKNARAIKYLLIACRKNDVRVRIDPTNLVAKKALKDCPPDVQGWVNGNVAYRDLAGKPPGKGGAMPVHAAGGTSPVPGPGHVP